MKRAIIAGLLLAGCQHRQPEPIVRTVEVAVPVMRPCLEASDIPALPAGLGPAPATQQEALSLALSRLLDWQIFGEQARALLTACAK